MSTTSSSPSPGSSAPTLVAYVSGHGFGHYTRSAPILDELMARGWVVHLRTSAEALKLARQNPGFASVTEVDVGPGTAQRGPLEVDLPATHAALQQHLAALPSLVRSEAQALRALGASLVYADVPPLAFAAAAEAGVTSVGLGNFSWSWIYEGYAGKSELGPDFARAAEVLRTAESSASAFLGLAMGGGLEHFTGSGRLDIGPIARPLRRSRREVRELLGLDGSDGDTRQVVLATFGGFGAHIDLGAALAKNPDYRFLVVSGPSSLPGVATGTATGTATRIASVTGARVHARSIWPTMAADGPLPTHPELVAAVDCLLGKPGYGTVAECLRALTPMVHVPRGEFREAAPMSEAIARWLPSAPLSVEDLYAGRWSPAIEAARRARPAEPAPALSGIDEAVAAIASLVSTGSERSRPT